MSFVPWNIITEITRACVVNTARWYSTVSKTRRNESIETLLNESYFATLYSLRSIKKMNVTRTTAYRQINSVYHSDYGMRSQISRSPTRLSRVTASRKFSPTLFGKLLGTAMK